MFRSRAARRGSNSDRYEINAEGNVPRSRGSMNGSMLRSLLEDRFKLRIRRETRDVPVYVLIPAGGGPKLQPAKPESCIAFDADQPPPPVDPSKPLPRLCGMARSTTTGSTRPAQRWRTLAGFSPTISTAVLSMKPGSREPSTCISTSLSKILGTPFTNRTIQALQKSSLMPAMSSLPCAPQFENSD